MGRCLAKVWGREYLDEVDYLRVYVRRLRDKLGDNPEKPRYIRTERGLGYRFCALPEPRREQWKGLRHVRGVHVTRRDRYKSEAVDTCARWPGSHSRDC